VKVWSGGLGILDSGGVQLSLDFAKWSKRAKVKFIITNLHKSLLGGGHGSRLFGLAFLCGRCCLIDIL